MSLSKQKKRQISVEAHQYASHSDIRLAYKAGATTEAEKAEILITGLRDILALFYDIEDSANCCQRMEMIAKSTLTEYNQFINQKEK